MKPYHKKRRFFKEEDGVFNCLLLFTYKLQEWIEGEGELCYIVKYNLR